MTDFFRSQRRQQVTTRTLHLPFYEISTTQTKTTKGAGGGTIQKSSPLDKGGTLEPKWQRSLDLLYQF